MNDKEKEITEIERFKRVSFEELKKEVDSVIQNQPNDLTKNSKAEIQVESESSTSDYKMTNEKINKFLNNHSSISKLVRRRQGFWTFQFADIAAYIMTDARKGVDRMRIMSLVSKEPKSFPQISAERLLRANCHEALDARFCYEHDSSLWSAFIHRLSTLTEEDLESGLLQVTELSRGFPFKLSSSDFYFRGKQPEVNL